MRIDQPSTVVNQRILVLASLLAIAVVGGLLRVHQIGLKSLWIDEAFSVWMGRQPVPEMIAWTTRIDQHPPLYYLLLRAWMGIGDAIGWLSTPQESAAWVRALSALASALNIPVLYALGQRLAGRRVGLLAALVLALSPFHVYLAQEARMYSLLCLNVSLALLALTHLLTSPSPYHRNSVPSWYPADETSPRGRSTRRGLAWSIYVLCTAAALWTHHTAILFFAAINLYILGLILVIHCRSTAHPLPHTGDTLVPPPLRAWIAAQAGVLLLWSPWLKPFARQAMGVYREFWLPAPTWSTVAGAIHNMMSAFLPSTIVGASLLWLLYVAMVLLSVHRLRKQPAVLALLATTFVTPIAGELLASLCRPVFYDRTLIWVSIPLYLLFATGANALREPGHLQRDAGSLCTRPGIPGKHTRPCRWTYALAAISLLAALNAVSLRQYYLHYQKEQWDGAAAYVAQHIQDGDLVLFHASWTQLPFDFYFQTEHSIVKRGLPVDLFDRGILEPKMGEQDLARLYELIRGHDRVWLVYSHNWYTDPQGLIPAALAKMGARLDQQQFHEIRLDLYGILPP